ncbi:MAG: DUF1036 domain-containing protein [Alphaproteobacteria bacterium]|nr:DUF1036 domain-containing protein [Alphaproteobacteria bacterium]
MKVTYSEYGFLVKEYGYRIIVIIKAFCKSLFSFMSFFALLLTLSNQAIAQFKLCNKTSNRVGIAIGYKGEGDWVTEGWWNIAPDVCELILANELTSRYYYIYAMDYDQGEEWKGKSYMCTQDKSFTIRGIHDCKKREFKRTGFLEIDTGNASSWTVRLKFPDDQKKAQ